jgi:hypothetical protein
VSEGLAQCFEEEVGAPTPFYAVFLDASALAKAEARAKEAPPLLPYDHNAWYFGRRGDADGRVMRATRLATRWSKLGST